MTGKTPVAPPRKPATPTLGVLESAVPSRMPAPPPLGLPEQVVRAPAPPPRGLTGSVIRPIHQKTASEMRAVLNRLTDFACRITEVGKDTELTSATVIYIVNGKLHPDLYYEFERRMRHDFPAEELSVTRIIEFLRAETVYN